MTDASDDPKPALRALFRQRRDEHVAGLSAEAREAAERGLGRIVASRLSRDIAAASYAGIGAEIDPRFVEEHMGPHAFPRVVGPGLLSFHIAAWHELVPGPLGIPHPVAGAPPVTPRLLLVPLLAATPDGVRLGQGGGFYDRALKALRARGPVTAIGLAWDVQVAEMLPSENWDQRLDWLATPTRLFDCRTKG